MIVGEYEMKNLFNNRKRLLKFGHKYGEIYKIFRSWGHPVRTSVIYSLMHVCTSINELRCFFTIVSEQWEKKDSANES